MNMVAGITWGGVRWSTPGSSVAQISYYFATTNEFSSYDETWTTIEKNAYRAAIASWAAVANILPIEKSSAGSSTFIEHSVADSFFNSPPGYVVLGEHEVPANAPADGFYNYQGIGWDYSNPSGGLNVGGFGYLTLVHEIGHGLGLAHPHDNGGGSPIWPGVDNSSDAGDYSLNQDVNTVMSYVHGITTKPVNGGAGADNYGYIAGPMAYDIAAIQSLYGAKASHTGNDTYVLPGTNGLGTYWSCIWDTGGVDTIYYSGSQACTVNLIAATLDSSPTGGGGRSYVPSVYGGFTIANGVVIENATTGSGNDTVILGSSYVDNVVNAGAGNDTVYVAASRDHFIFGGSASNFYTGGNGVDTLIGVEDIVFTDGIHATPASLLPVQVPWTADEDFNFDFTSDLLLRESGGSNAIWTLQNGGIQSGSYLPNAGVNWKIAGTGDFNGDGNSDVLIREDSGPLAIWSMSGTTITSGGYLPNPGPTWNVAATADISGDGRADIVLRHDSGQLIYWTMNGTSITSGYYLPNTGPSWRVAAAADFDGDGKSELFLHEDGGANVIWKITNGGVAAGLYGPSTPAMKVVGTGDFNGDNKADVLLRADSGEMQMWFVDGPKFVTSAALPNAGPTWRATGIGDFNDDGRADIVLHEDGGNNAIWLMDGASIQAAIGLPNAGPSWIPYVDHIIV